MKITDSLRRHKVLTVVASAAVVAAVVVAAVLFQPWRLFTSSTVDEALPGTEQTTAPAATGSGPPSAAKPSTPAMSDPGQAGPAPSATPAAPRILSKGTFVSQEHPTTGTASLVKLPDGGLVLRLEKLASSDGPDVKVWLSNQEAGGDWFKYRSGKWLDLGPVKATHGNQNYAIPAGSDISGLTTVVLWCDRFSVAFGSAALA
ncbi:hypothetical protein BIU82_01225 [Arthrobacter sp. SW1]|uniref:DM13 domain-containing protein n=1 Tax=Arthrobacter sp. SW1 TaxID=1920889 RepID=UPI000877B5F0|nr:DM13 domain-containing protein [Arthrobacter sp. SW1]OFI39706.1 hypothetical protein BIU82_01225 [Arthrobacter sp. SW1]